MTPSAAGVIWYRRTEHVGLVRGRAGPVLPRCSRPPARAQPMVAAPRWWRQGSSVRPDGGRPKRGLRIEYADLWCGVRSTRMTPSLRGWTCRKPTSQTTKPRARARHPCIPKVEAAADQDTAQPVGQHTANLRCRAGRVPSRLERQTGGCFCSPGQFWPGRLLSRRGRSSRCSPPYAHCCDWIGCCPPVTGKSSLAAFDVYPPTVNGTCVGSAPGDQPARWLSRKAVRGSSPPTEDRSDDAHHHRAATRPAPPST